MAKGACADHAIHVHHDKTLDRWDVVGEDGGVIGHAGEQRDAVILAIRQAQHAHGQGHDVVVCVEQPDGHYSLAWSP